MEPVDSSFVMVDHALPPSQAQVESLNDFFPFLTKPSTFIYADQAVLDSIYDKRRAAPDGRLFADELLGLAGLDGPSVYPPTSPNALRTILLDVSSSTSLSSLNITSILYYLALASSSSTAAAAFAQSRLLPPEFALSIRAFHALDSGDYPLAIRLLSDPRIRQPDFVSKTINILATGPKAEERHKLVLAYWRLTGLQLNKEQGKIGVEEAELVLKALCDPKRKRGAAEAWELARQWGDETDIARLMKAVLSASFGDNHTRLPAPQHLQTLLSFPFTSAELSLLNSYCLSPPSSRSPSAQTLVSDWFLSLLISSSKPLQALIFYNKLKQNGKVQPSDERDRLLNALEETLTTSQKTTLSIEIAAISASAPSKPAQSTSTASSNSITQPAWVPPPSAAAPSTPIAPPRTLAAARQAKLPAPASPAPRPSDLPLSASPFVRKDGGAGQGVLKALKERESLVKQNTGLGSPARGPGTPIRTGILPPASSVGTGAGGRERAGSPFTFAPTASVAGESENATPVKPKPTLAGFGSVRQTPQPRPTSQPREIEMGDDREEEEDMEQDEIMLVPSPQAAPSRPQPQRQPSTSKREDDFSRRIALDPAIQKTLLAASTSSKPSPPSTSETPRPEASSSRTPKRTRTSNGQQGQKERTAQRGDKRRAISTEPQSQEGGEGKEKAKEKEKERPDQDKTVKLPPGAFPGVEEDEPTRPVRRTRESSTQPEMSEVGKGGGGRRSTRQSATTSSRRGSRARSVSVAPSEDGDAPPTPTRRSSRGSSLQPPEMSEVQKQTPVRRSSRLSSSTTLAKEEKGTKRSTAGGRRGQKAIEEEDEGIEEDSE